MAEASSIYTIEALLERHDREWSAFKLLNPAEQARAQVRMRAQYAADPWSFLTSCVYTLDQVSSTHPIKPFPSFLEYLAFLTGVWQQERMLAVPKSRRMFCSWNFISLFLHDTIFNRGRFHGFVSKKEDDAADLIGRAESIFNRIPEWRIPKSLLPAIKNGKMSKQPPVLEFPEIDSKIQGFPQGADQMRQHTLSGIFGDECAFWEDAQAFYSASKPTLDGGGRMTLVSSRSPGFFKKIVFDQLDALDLTFKEVAPVKPESPIEGVEYWKNPRNKFFVVDLHYSADPRKRGETWREAVRQSMPVRDFLMEYEKSWQTFEGRAVFPDFQRSLHVAKRAIPPEPGIPLLLAWDFGLTPACLIGQLVGRQLRVIKEFQEQQGSISKLAPVVWNYLNLNYLPWLNGDDKLFCYIDPAGFQKAQTDERTCAGILRENGFKKITPGPVSWEQRRKAVEDYLTKTYAEGPALLVAEEECPILIEGLGGGYRYADRETEPDKIRPLKDKFSHLADCMQYLAAGVSTLKRTYGIDIPIPNYNFQTTS